MDAVELATVADYAARYGDPGDEGRCEVLLKDATAMLLAAYERCWGTEYEEGAHSAFDRSAAPVACKLVRSVLTVPDGFSGATQYSQGAGGYTASVSFGGPSGDMWLGKTDLEALGLTGQRLRSIKPEGF